MSVVLDESTVRKWTLAGTTPLGILPPWTRSWLALTLAGLGATCFIVLAGGEVGPVHGSTPFSTWFGLLDHDPVDPVRAPMPGLMLVTGIVLLIAVWFLVLQAIRAGGGGAGQWSPRRLWSMAAIWSLPLLVGPPMLSSDVYAYAAQGMQAAHGLDPYTTGVSALGNAPVVLAVDPVWRGAHSPYGPLATALEHIAYRLSGGSALGTVLLLRLFSVVAVIAIAVLAMALAEQHRRGTVFALTALNPILLLQVVSAAHFEGVQGALLLGALVALQRERTYLALVLGCAAGLVKAPAFVVIGVIAVVVWHQTEPARRARVVAAMTGTVAASVAAMSAVVPHGWGWMSTMTTPGLGFTPDAPATLCRILLTPFTVWTGLTTTATLESACRMAAMSVMALVVLYLLATCRRRTACATTGWALLAVSVLGPVIYPWYLLWGLLCLIPNLQGRRWQGLLMLSVLGSMMAIQGLAKVTIGCLASAIILSLGSWTVWTVRSGRTGAVPGARSSDAVAVTA